MAKKLTKKATKILNKVTKSKTSAARGRTITVKNAEGDPDTTATILIQNKIDYTPRVSVIIPVYNVEKYLRECLDSVVNQTLREIEIICVDDGSTDSSLEILKEYAKKDPRITVITQKNLHAGVARNAGLSIARGEYLSFLDSDDFFELNMLEETYKNAEQDESDIVVYKYKNLDITTNEISEPRGINIKTEQDIQTFSTDDLANNLFTTCNPMPWNKLFNHETIKQNGLFFQSLAACNDVYFSLSAMSVSKRITYMNASFVYYRHNRQNSLKNSRDKYPLNFYTAYSELFNTLNKKRLFDKYVKTFINSFFSSSMWTLDNTQKKHAFVKDFIKSTIYPKYIKNYKHLLSDSLKTRLNRTLSNEIIISLTSYPARIGTVNQTIESLLNQTVKADKVILWLAPEQFPNREKDLPKQLLDLCDKGLTIDWYHDIKSYKKLIPALQKYPDAIIVTADDDLIFAPNWLDSLYQGYLKHPNDINIHRATKFYRDKYGWHVIPGGIEFYTDGSPLNKLCSGAGAIYPPHCFYKDMLDEVLFLKLAPTNDDQWIWIQAVLNNKKIYVVDNNQPKLTYVHGTQETGLCKINDNGQKLFWKDFQRIIAYYPQAKKILLKEAKKHKIVKDFVVPYRKELEAWYTKIRGPINLDNPKTFNEKIQWSKIYDSTPIKTKLADKYLVRDWVAEKIGEKYLIPLLGVYDSFDEIDFDKLPNQFVIKCNHGCAYNIIVKNKSELDLADVKAKLDKWMHENFAFKFGVELHYRDIEPKIVIEKFIENKKSGGDLYDYKFWCFDGKVYYIQFLSERNLDGLKMAFYDKKWNKQHFVYSHPLDQKNIDKPSNLDKMIKLAEKLSKGFNHVRVDFYRLDDGTIYFGEMTFTSASGTCKWNDEKINRYFGKLFKLPKMAYNIDTGEYYKLPRIKKHINIKPYLLFPYYLLANLWLKWIYIPVLKFIKHTRAIWYSHSHRGKMDMLNDNFKKIMTTVQSVQNNMQKQIDSVKNQQNDLAKQLNNIAIDAIRNELKSGNDNVSQQIINVDAKLSETQTHFTKGIDYISNQIKTVFDTHNDTTDKIYQELSTQMQKKQSLSARQYK